ncbi:MAG TPA: hypothetical protein DIV52_01745 [Ruminococcaceae bacterium]|nr:hypothetical protein [Oscillospiraceae bacterium]
MPMPKKTKKRIIFWSVFLGIIVIGLIVLFVTMNSLINNTNRQIADKTFYGDHGGVKVDEFASAVADAINE